MKFAQVRLSESDIKAAKRALIFVEDGFPKAYARALNKSATSVRTDMVGLVRKEYNYKAAAIRKRIEIRRATRADLSASLYSSGRHVNLTDIIGTRKTKKGVSVNVKKSTGRKLIPRAFINQGVKSGKRIVLRRPGNPRGQRKKLWARYGPPGSGGKVGSMARLDYFEAVPVEIIYNTPQNWARIQKKAGAHIKKHFAHEVDVVLKGIA